MSFWSVRQITVALAALGAQLREPENLMDRSSGSHGFQRQ